MTTWADSSRARAGFHQDSKDSTMATFRPFYSFKQDAFNGVHNLASNTLKMFLTNEVPDFAADDEKADLTDLSTANGYTAGGATLTGVSSTQTGGVYVLKSNDISWTASGGDIGPFRSAVLYNDTASGDKLICAVVYETGIVIPAGETFTVDVNPTTGFFYVG